MTIPKQLKIGGHIYTIKFVDAEDIDNACGEQNPTRNIIKIREDLPQSQIEETLIHEILHAMNTDLSATIVGFLSTALYQILKDNKLLNT